MENKFKNVNKKVIRKMEQIDLPKEINIIPTSEGTIRLEYENNHNYLEIELFSNHNTIFAAYQDGSITDEYIDTKDIEKETKEFVEGFTTDNDYP